MDYRNFKNWFKKSPLLGKLMTGVEHWFLPKVGVATPPWTLHNTTKDHTKLRPAAEMPQISYPKPDGVISFDRLSSVFVSNTNHEEQQPAHLTLKDASVPVSINLAKYAGPESRYCRQASTSSSRTPTTRTACRSTRRTACTARPATSRIRRRTSSGSRQKAAAGRTTLACERLKTRPQARS